MADGEQRDESVPPRVQRLWDAPIDVRVELGRTVIELDDAAHLEVGAVLDLDRGAPGPVDVYLGGLLFAQGEAVTVDGRYGVRLITVREAGEQADPGVDEEDAELFECEPIVLAEDQGEDGDAGDGAPAAITEDEIDALFG